MGVAVAGPKRAGGERPTLLEETWIEQGAKAHREERRREASVGPHRPDLRGYIYLSLMVLFGSTTSPFAMVAVRELPVGILPLLRFSFATLCLIPFSRIEAPCGVSCARTPAG